VEHARFGLELLSSAFSPSNFPLTNPVALRRAFDTKGMGVLRRGANLLHDAVANGGIPAQVDRQRYRVGRELAATPGKVVHRSPVFELFEYRSTTSTVHAVPLLVVPPVINRYYFVDLSPGRSLVEHLVASGFRVFLVSSKIAQPGDGHLALGDYTAALLQARIIAVDKVSTKLDLALKFGATDVVEAGDDAPKNVRDLTGGAVDYAFEAIGPKTTTEQAWAMLRAGGRPPSSA
jgi:polyhydroxyalkanoate synthase